MRERYGALVPARRAPRRPRLHLRRDGRRARSRPHLRAERREPAVERVEGGLLGAEFEADDSGRYRIAKIFPGENWDDDYRSPLTEPGVDVEEGDFLLAIDGVELTTGDNPYRLLEGKGRPAGRADGRLPAPDAREGRAR